MFSSTNQPPDSSRPRKRDDQKRRNVIHCRFTDTERERLGAVAKRLNKPMSGVLLSMLSVAEHVVLDWDAAREAKERERQEELNFLDSAEGQAAMAEYERQYGRAAAEQIREWRRRQR